MYSHVPEARPDFAQWDTIVVGAGVSGLTVARLLALGGQRVLVLEARDRIGGRLHTDRTGGRTTDRGASWIHGIDHSPLWDVTQALQMNPAEFTVGAYQVDSRPIAYFGPSGVRLSDSEAAAFAHDLHATDEVLLSVVAASAPGTSYQEVTEQALSELCDQGGFGDEPEASERAQRVREYLQHRAEEQYGVCSAELDAHGLDDDQPDGDEVVFPDGYDVLASRLAEGLDVRMSHRVTEVIWAQENDSVSVAAGSQGATVRTGHGPYSADRVVLTIPVGVLKSGDVRITPPLPEPNAGALSRLEMNNFEKVVLRFDTKFWDDGIYAFRRQGEAGSWWHSWYDLTAAQGEPTLLTFAAGPCARTVRDWRDEEVAASVLSSLREIYGDTVPEPVRVDVTHWQDDEFSRGSYAYNTVGSPAEDHTLLAEPIGGGVLHLAGEATWEDDPATVTAALLSGHRAAERILGQNLNVLSIVRSLASSATGSAR